MVPRSGEECKTRALPNTGSTLDPVQRSSLEDRAADKWERDPVSLSTLWRSYRDLGSCASGMARENEA